MDVVTDMQTAVSMVRPGARIGVGGVQFQRKPMSFLQSLAATGTGELRLYTFLGSLDVELLAANGLLAEAHSGYVGFEQHGFAPSYDRAVSAGTIHAVEYTEYLFTAAIRAAVGGLPFFPTSGGLGSDVLAELGYRTIRCPYTGRSVVAVPAMELDVTVIHAYAADPRGNIVGPPVPDFLHDLDANMARAAKRVIVTVENLVSTEELRADPARTLLFAHEVDAVVQVRRGALPCSMPGDYDPDVAAIRGYLDAVQADPGGAAAAMSALLAGGNGPGEHASTRVSAGIR